MSWKWRSLKYVLWEYNKHLLDRHIDYYEDLWTFWDLFELFISFNLSIEWQSPKYAHTIAKEIIRKLKEDSDSNWLIKVIRNDIRYAYIEKDGNVYQANLLKHISNSFFNKKRKVEIINLWWILHDLLWDKILKVFTVLEEYKKPNQSFEFIHINELDQTVVNSVIELLKQHAEEYNLGEIYIEDMTKSIEQFMNNLWNTAFNSFLNN